MLAAAGFGSRATIARRRRGERCGVTSSVGETSPCGAWASTAWLSRALHFGAALGGPAGLIDLASTRDGERIRRNILGDDRSSGDVRAVANAHRRDQRGIAADKNAAADRGRVLRDAVVIARDRAGADIRSAARWSRRPDSSDDWPSRLRAKLFSSARRNCPRARPRAHPRPGRSRANGPTARFGPRGSNRESNAGRSRHRHPRARREGCFR